MTQQQAKEIDTDDSGAAESGTLTPGSADQLSAVADLIGGKPADKMDSSEKGDAENDDAKTLSESLAEAEKPADSGENQDTVKPPKTLDDIAEQLGIEVSDLYAITFPSADSGKSQTIGELKDLLAKNTDFAGRELELSERRVEFGNEQATARAELETVLAALPKGAIKPEVLALARKERETVLNREAARVLDVIPEWKNDETKRAELVTIGEHMAQYGFDAGHIDTIYDHRMLRYMRENNIRRLLVEKAMAGVKPVKEKPKSQAKKPAGKKVQKSKVGPDSTQSEQLAAIGSLLKTG